MMKEVEVGQNVFWTHVTRDKRTFKYRATVVRVTAERVTVELPSGERASVSPRHLKPNGPPPWELRRTPFRDTQ